MKISLDRKQRRLNYVKCFPYLIALISATLFLAYCSRFCNRRMPTKNETIIGLVLIVTFLTMMIVAKFLEVVIETKEYQEKNKSKITYDYKSSVSIRNFFFTKSLLMLSMISVPFITVFALSLAKVIDPAKMNKIMPAMLIAGIILFSILLFDWLVRTIIETNMDQYSELPIFIRTLILPGALISVIPSLIDITINGYDSLIKIFDQKFGNTGMNIDKESFEVFDVKFILNNEKSPV